MGRTLDGLEYDIPALLNYSAVDTFYKQNDPKILESLLLAPRKVYTGVKVVKES